MREFTVRAREIYGSAHPTNLEIVIADVAPGLPAEDARPLVGALRPLPLHLTAQGWQGTEMPIGVCANSSAVTAVDRLVVVVILVVVFARRAWLQPGRHCQ